MSRTRSGREPIAGGRPSLEPASAQGPVEPSPSRPEQLNLFSCVIDESAGLAEDREYQKPLVQLTELPGETWEDIFRDGHVPPK